MISRRRRFILATKTIVACCRLAEMQLELDGRRYFCDVFGLYTTHFFLLHFDSISSERGYFTNLPRCSSYICTYNGKYGTEKENSVDG